MDYDDIYFPVYQNIEKDVLELTSSICFTDNHLEVFSLKIADLIIRCAIELESIAKELYRRETKKEPTNTGLCFNWIEENWRISKKMIKIVSPYFHFKSINLEFFPFDYKDDSSDNYYKCYCAIKHDRVKNLNKATINVLIRILGALYILNLYYRNKNINLNKDIYASNNDKSGGSSIFNFTVAPCLENVIMDSDKDINSETCIYKIHRKESLYSFNIVYLDSFDEENSGRLIQTNKVFQNYAKQHVGENITEDELLNFMSEHCNIQKEMLRDGLFNRKNIKNIISIVSQKMKSVYYLELNK